MFTVWSWLRAQSAPWIVVTAVMAMPCALQAGENPKAPPHGDAARTMTVVSLGEQPFWLGVMATPVDALLKSHLHLERGLVVHHVVPDSPGAKAGIREHDILLKYEGQAVGSVPELAKQIAERKDKPAKITLLREGKETTVTATPAKPPAHAAIPPLPPGGEWDSITKWLEQMRAGQGADTPLRMWHLQPGIVVPEDLKDLHGHALIPHLGAQGKAGGNLPKNMAITITKSGEEPAKITVKRDGQTWEVNEKELDKLPEEVRPHVKQMLGKDHQIWTFGDDGIRLELHQQGAAEPKTGRKDRPAKKAGVDELNQRLEELTRQQRDADKRLQEELERIRKELDRVKAN